MSVQENVKFIVGDRSGTSLNNSSKHSENEDENSIAEENSNEGAAAQTTPKTSNNETEAFLKNEVNSLNQEIKSLLKRIKSVEDGK